jgi:hypothetical protein
MLDLVSRCALSWFRHLDEWCRACLLTAICLWLTSSCAAAAPLKLYVLAGQSNMSGWGQVGELPVEARSPQSDVLYHTSGAGFGFLRTTDDDFGPELEFGRTMSAAIPETIAVVKHAIGSTSLAEEWNPSLGDNIYTALMTRITNARQFWSSAGYEVQIAGVVWMQGEEDARRATMAPLYEANLLNFIDQIRADLHAKDAPFIFGQIRGAEFPYREQVRAAQIAVDRADIGAYLVETDDLTTWEGLHFDTSSQLTLGRRFATAMLGARSEVPGDANGDGQVGIADLNAVRNNFGAYGEGDVTRDGLISIDDLNLVRNEFGAGLNANAKAVPEPSAWVLVAIGVVALGGRRYVTMRAAALTNAALHCYFPHARVTCPVFSGRPDRAGRQ